VRWIDQVLDATIESESPRRFFYWAALTAIAAVMRKNVYLDRFYYKLYPNIYVLFVARSGSRKGVPVSLARSLVANVNCTRVIAGRNSIQAIIAELSKAHTLESGEVLKHAHALVISGELAAFLIKDPDALTILTDLYDTHYHEPHWTNTLKSGTERLHEPCLTLLAATNEAHFVEVIPAAAVEGGLIARTFIVLADKKGPPNPLTERPTRVPNVKELSKYLKEISKVKGEFAWSDEAKELYNKWYLDFDSQEHNDTTGTIERIGDQVLKVAMLLSLAESPELVLTAKNIEEALDVCLGCVTGVKQVTMGSGKSPLAYQTKLILRELISRPDHCIDRQKVLQKFWGELDSFDLDRIVETLLGAGAINVQRHGTKVVYVLKESALEQYTKIKGMIQ